MPDRANRGARELSLLCVPTPGYVNNCLLLSFVGVSISFGLVTGIMTATYLPIVPSSVINANTRVDEHQGVRNFSSPHEVSGGCPTYGCPIYPQDYAVEWNQTTRPTRANWPGAVTPLRQVTAITWQSNEHRFNQDRTLFISPFRTQQTLPLDDNGEHAGGTGSPSFLLAILDGHGVDGHIVAAYVQTALPQKLMGKLNQRHGGQSDAWVAQQLKDTFIEINQEAPPNNALRGGCTASVTLRIGNRLFFANAGDSRSILVQTNQTSGLGEVRAHVVYQTRRDKPHLPDERARIERLGGKIHIPLKNPALSRVVVYSKAAQPPELIGLAMSRSIGDWEWKAVGVTAEPLVDVIRLPRSSMEDTGSFVLAASDGLWDLRRVEFFAQRYAVLDKSFYQTTMEILGQVSLMKGYRDDISVVVVPTSP